MSNWKYLHDEIEGIHKNKSWLSNGTDRALFKPDTENNESAVEYEAYKIASVLDIPCAKIDIIEFDGKKGCISYDVKERDNPDIIYLYPDDLYQKGNKLTNRSKASDGTELIQISNVTLEHVKTLMPHILPKVIEMLFLDCVVRNNDRHGHNWEVIMNRNGDVLDVAPLYDHGLALWNDKNAMNTCRLPYADDVLLTHYAMFEQLCIEEPVLMKSLMTKCKNVKLHEYAQKRLEQMKTIYDKVIGKN